MKRGEENKTKQKQCRKQQSCESSVANKLSASLSNSVWEAEELASGIALCHHHNLPDKYLSLFDKIHCKITRWDSKKPPEIKNTYVTHTILRKKKLHLKKNHFWTVPIRM